MSILSSFLGVTGGGLQSRGLLAYVCSKTDSQENRAALEITHWVTIMGSEILCFDFFLCAFQVIIFCHLDYSVYKGHLITIPMRHYLGKLFHTCMVLLLNTINCLILHSSVNKYLLITYLGWYNYV